MERGWFPEDGEGVMNEVSLVDTDGQVYRPDRVVKSRGKVVVIDYKFGEHYRKYEHQMKKYTEQSQEANNENISKLPSPCDVYKRKNF